MPPYAAQKRRIRGYGDGKKDGKREGTAAGYRRESGVREQRGERRRLYPCGIPFQQENEEGTADDGGNDPHRQFLRRKQHACRHIAPENENAA